MYSVARIQLELMTIAVFGTVVGNVLYMGLGSLMRNISNFSDSECECEDDDSDEEED